MGGFGSGRFSSRCTTSNYYELDIRHMHRKGMLKPNRSCTWNWLRNGEVLSCIRVSTRQDAVTLTYSHKPNGKSGERKNYPIYIDWTSCHFGGERPWFLCPASGCGRRVAILYCGGIFACRHCYNLAYACQSETIHDRELRRVEKIRDRLGWEPGILSRTGSRPKGMHFSTYKKLINEHNILRMRTFEWFDSCFDKLE